MASLLKSTTSGWPCVGIQRLIQTHRKGEETHEPMNLVKKRENMAHFTLAETTRFTEIKQQIGRHPGVHETK